MKVNYDACDLCGEPIDNSTIEIKCKQHWASGLDHGKTPTTLCICSRCQAKLRRMFQRSVGGRNGR